MNPFRMQWRRRATSLGAVVALAATALPVRAAAAGETPPQGEPKTTRDQDKAPTFVGAAGAAGGSSTWRGDPVGVTSLKLGFRFLDAITPYYLGRLGYAAVNDRSVLDLSFGLQGNLHFGPARPYARVSIVHQHEESLAAIKADTGGALTGVGDGIRHRSGPEFGVGCEITLHRERKLEVVGVVESSMLYFPDPRGPSEFFFGALALGLNYTL